MKAFSLLIIVVIFLPQLSDALSLQETKRQQNILEQMDSLIRDGNKQAIDESTHLDASITIPFLMRYLADRTMDPNLADRARDIIAGTQGHGEIIRNWIIAHDGEPMAKLRGFEALQQTGSKEAVKALCYFLMNDNTPSFVHEDVSLSSGKSMVVSALLEMNLPDAPIPSYPHANDQVEVVKWTRWWNSHKSGYD